MSKLEALKIALDALNNVPLGWIAVSLDERDSAREAIKQMIEKEPSDSVSDDGKRDI